MAYSETSNLRTYFIKPRKKYLTSNNGIDIERTTKYTRTASLLICYAITNKMKESASLIFLTIYIFTGFRDGDEDDNGDEEDGHGPADHVKAERHFIWEVGNKC